MPLELSSVASGPMHFMVLGPASETMLLIPLSLPHASTGPRPLVPDQHPQAGLEATLGALQQRVHRL